MFKISQSAAEALSILWQNGFEAYLVGGCVRDMLMGFEPKDWDITTNATPQQVKAAFRGEIVIETGIKHGTVTVLIGSGVERESLEVTTFREDIGYSDHRRPDSVSFAATLKEDVSRRDFTINSLAFCPERGVIDYFGGADDIKARTIRCVGDAGRRFNEDALRMLRALRFSSTLGFRIERETSASIHQNKELLRSVSAERINIELTKMICGCGAGATLREFADVVGVVIPEIIPMIGFYQHNKYHCYDVWRHTIEVMENCEPTHILRWAALLHDIGKPDCFSLDSDGIGHFYGHAALSKQKANIVMYRLKFDNATRERVLTLVERHDVSLIPEARVIKRYLNRLGEDALRQLLLLRHADIMGHAPEYRYRIKEIEQIQALMEQVIAEVACFSLKDLAIDGKDIVALGLKGKEIGDALKFLLNAVIDDLVPNERSTLLRYLDENLLENGRC